MNADELRALQAPLKQKYKDDEASALITMHAEGRLDQPDVACHVETFTGSARAGLHPAAGGSTDFACSGDMLLEALSACAGVPREPPTPAPPPVPAATWESVDRELLLAARTARAHAAAYAEAGLDLWLGRVRRYTDEAFVPWYTSYWTQEWLAVKFAWPRHIEAWADEFDEPGDGAGS